ncbi:protein DETOXIFICATION 16 isoform X1 [Ziziphus jujuba]|uniref:Protein DETOXIFICATION n=1 Tax=Ziziphus jujuba TaxID=326968 RepID=A0ABM4A1W7_ZIZJJ|nr:protein DETOXIFICATION 16 isoform X1 [Ziziphus jujuba]
MERNQEQMPYSNTPQVQVGEENGGANGRDEKKDRRSKIIMEVKKQLWLAGPLIAVNMLLFCLQVISVMFVGHLGELSLSGASVGTSFAAVTGFSLLMGLSTALETLSGQAYGAKQYDMMGIYMQRAMFILLLGCIPLAIIWANTRSILTLLGQNAAIAAEAGQYALFMIPSIFAYALLQCFFRFLQTQNIVFPMVLSCGITTLLHVFMCWILVFKSGLGNRGAAMANSISYWINVLLLGLYVKFSSSCAKTWTGFSKESFRSIPAFLKLAIPSAVMICLEMWSFEMLVLLSGLLPNPKLETSVLSISLNTVGTVWMIPSGLSAAVSTRVSNELGAGNPKAARLSVLVVLVLAITEGLFVASILIMIRNFWGYAYSKETEVVKYVSKLMPILAVLCFIDGLQSVLSGNARVCGWQKLGAYVNLGSYYLVGIPSAVLLAFVFHVGGKGLCLGIICALVVQLLFLFTITIRTNWEQEAKKATKRIHDSKIPVHVVS